MKGLDQQSDIGIDEGDEDTKRCHTKETGNCPFNIYKP